MVQEQTCLQNQHQPHPTSRQHSKTLIRKTLENLESKLQSCVRFIESNISERVYIRNQITINNRTILGCQSPVGNQFPVSLVPKDTQDMILTSPWCMTPGTIEQQVTPHHAGGVEPPSVLYSITEEERILPALYHGPHGLPSCATVVVTRSSIRDSSAVNNLVVNIVGSMSAHSLGEWRDGAGVGGTINGPHLHTGQPTTIVSSTDDETYGSNVSK